MNGMTFWQLKNVSGLFVGSNLADSTNMALVVAEWLGNKKFNEVKNFILTVLASTNGNDVCIVVLASQFCSSFIPSQCGTNAFDLVCGNLLAAARPTQNDA